MTAPSWAVAAAGARAAIVTGLAAVLLIATPIRAPAQVCAEPSLMQFKVTGKIVRSRVGFTQGLELGGGVLYESTGSYEGTTQLNTISLDGKVTTLADQGRRVFGEGLTILNDEVIQLTWRERQVFVYDLAGKLKRQMRNPRDGWGLSHDGSNLLFTDGGSSLYYADPKSFKIGRSVKIRAGKSEVAGVNELERVDGKLYGNIFTTRSIVRFDPESGCIDAVADLSPLWSGMTSDERASASSPENVLNGIAHDGRTGLFYLTGKRWRAIFVGRFTELK
ncbi:MAG: glutaminyl-peptide cyclotransferase [Hyphomicrobiales bacterium]|nr:glutaminyl-peptide cyclotransferase [Hyphomicrobiales bacterium]